MAIQQFINDGKNPDEELRKLHPALDTRVLSKNVVDFFRTRKYKNIRDLDRKGVFQSDTFRVEKDPSKTTPLEDQFGSYTAGKIVRLNNQLNMEFENVDRFIGKLTKKQDSNMMENIFETQNLGALKLVNKIRKYSDIILNYKSFSFVIK